MLSHRMHTALYYSRRRRKSLAAAPVRLFRTGVVGYNTTILSDNVPNKSKDFTFEFKIEVTAANITGELVRFGNSTSSTTVSLLNGVLTFESGPTGAKKTGSTTYVPLNTELHIVASVRPTRGSIRLWVNGSQKIDLQSNTASISYADSEDGQYASPVSGVTFLSTLGLYTLQVPRHYTPILGEQTATPTDDYLLHATAVNFDLEFYPWIN